MFGNKYWSMSILGFLDDIINLILFQQREVTLSSKDTSCVINKCLPGTTHFVRLLALDGEANIQDKSKQLTIQTSAPPDAPLIAIR